MSDTPSLGQRWIAACRRAGVEPWAAGMLDTRGDRVLCAHGAIVVTDEVSLHYGGYVERESVGLVPDLSDPATAGAAIGVLRAWSGDPGLCVTHYDGPPAAWGVSSVAVALIGLVMVDTEAGALVAAAEALAAGGGR